MKRMIITVNRVSPNLAVCNLTDGTRYEIRGTEASVDRQVAKYLEGGIVPDEKDCINPVANLVTNLVPHNPNAPRMFIDESDPNGDPADMAMPTINWQSGQIERNGKPIRERPVLRATVSLFTLHQQPALVANAGSEENQPAYTMPTMDFSDRLITHQPGKPVERQHGSKTTFVANGNEENEPVYTMPKMNFDDRK